MLDKYTQFAKKLRSQGFPSKQIISNPLYLYAYSTDASFYRLVPKLVLKVNSADQVAHALQLATKFCVGVTFRAAGTSLSGQSTCCEVLIVLSDGFRFMEILENGRSVRLGPAIIGGHVNNKLAAYGRKIGPDPASIDSAMVGGIAANNSSGMCCGVEQNTYHTLRSMKVVFADGSMLDTALLKKTNNAIEKNSISAYVESILLGLKKLSREVARNKQMSALIKRKFAIKNTTGYSLNALIDFKDPIDILQHLLIGSEGTLGFINEITLNTVVQHKHRAVGLFVFKNPKQACTVAARLGASSKVAVVELMDSVSLASVAGKKRLPAFLAKIKKDNCGLLVEVNAASSTALATAVKTVKKIIEKYQLEYNQDFSTNLLDIANLWKVRKELFPTVGTARKLGTTVVIEDIVFPLKRLADGMLALRKILNANGYHDAVIFGHALAGNLHFVFSQDLSDAKEVERYAVFMDEVCAMVLSLEGSLKGEHGTGRNMAPYVEKEWGEEAYALMQRIKDLFDPQKILNADVIFSSDKNIHLKNFKQMSPVADEIDKCTECGYCESVCPSRAFTLTPRQRIAVAREIARIKLLSKPERILSGKVKMLGLLQREFSFAVEKTCATDSMCATACPIDIDTGAYVKKLRSKKAKKFFNTARYRFFADHFSKFLFSIKVLLAITGVVKPLSKKLRSLPSAARLATPKLEYVHRNRLLLILPSCLSRAFTFQPALPGIFPTDNRATSTIAFSVLEKLGYQAMHVGEKIGNDCCGLAFSSKGYNTLAKEKQAEVYRKLCRKVEKINPAFDGNPIVLSDMASCSQQWKEFFIGKPFDFYDISDFIATHGLLRSLEICKPQEEEIIKESTKPFNKKTETTGQLAKAVKTADKHTNTGYVLQKIDACVAVFIPCSATKMGIERSIVQLVSRCVREMVVVENIACCGFAGDKGFKLPQLNASALVGLKEQIAACDFGVSTSITCQIGLSKHAGIPFYPLVKLLDKALTKKVMPSKIDHRVPSHQ